MATYAVLVILTGVLACKVGWQRRRGPGEDDGVSSAVSPAGARDAWGTAIWLGLSLVCLLQALPLPRHWLEGVAFDNADIWSRWGRPFAAPPPAFASISLAPGRSLVEALKMASYGVVFCVAARIGRRHGFGHIARILFGCALAVAVVAAAHQLVNARALYGVYEPLDAPSVAPLFNANNRAGYLLLGFFCGVGLLFRAQGRTPALIAVGLVVIVAELLLCQSRGATLSWVLGLLVVLLVSLLPKIASPTARSRRWQTGTLAAITLTAGFLAVLAARGEGWKRLADDSLEKVSLFRASARLVEDHAWLGIGRGAFGSVFGAYQPTGTYSSFDHAENLPLQWAAEWGVPLTLLALGAIAWSVWPAFGLPSLSSPVRRCGLVGAGALFLHNFFDLGLEVPAVAAAWVCAVGGLCGAAASDSVPAASSGGGRSRTLVVATALTGVCLGAAWLGGSDTLPVERARLFDAIARRPRAAVNDFWTALRGAMREFPAEPYFPLLGSHAALLVNENPLPWINRALERGPRSAQAHVQLARILEARAATAQALVALRRAVELDGAQARAVLELGLSWGLSPEALLGAVPAGRVGARSLQHLAERTSDSVLAIRWLEEAVSRDPEDPDAHYALAHGLYRDLVQGSSGPVCGERRQACLEQASREVELAYRPGVARDEVLTALLLALQGASKEAEPKLERACRELPRDRACAEALVKVALDNRSPGARDAVRRLVATGCTSPERCAETHLRLGDLFAGRKDWYLALTHFRLATQEVPSPRSWLAVAQAADRLRQSELATEARRRAKLLAEQGPGAAPEGPPPQGRQLAPQPAAIQRTQ